MTRREAAATAGMGGIVALACVLIAQLNPSFFWHDDNQIGGVPAILEITRALRAFELPLVSPTSWCAGAFAGEYQAGLFSPLVMGAMLLAAAVGGTMPGIATAYAAILLAVTAMGAFRVGRVEGLAAPHAAIVGLVAALNGWSMSWAASNWIVAMSGFAALTWAWWAQAAMLRPDAGLRRLLAAGGATYLLMAAGWPHTIFMMAIVSAWLLVREGWRQGPTRPLGAIVGAWLLGIGLSAPAWITFVQYLGSTMRPAVGAELQWTKVVPAEALPGLFLPTWITLWDLVPTPVMSLANGVVPTAVVLVALALGRRRDLAPGAWALGLAGIGLALACLPSLGMFRWSFRWLPLFHTAFALAAAQWLAAWLAAPPAPPAWARSPGLARLATNPGAWAALAVVVVGAASRMYPVFSLALPAAYLVIVGAWALAEDRLPAADPYRRWAPASATMAVLVATYAMIPNGLQVPFWLLDEGIRQVAPLRPDVRYLALASGGDYFQDGVTMPGWGTTLRPGNTAMASGARFVNGYSPLQVKGLSYTFLVELHGYIHEEALAHLAHTGTKPGGVLQRVGVDGVVVGDASRKLIPVIRANGWVEGPGAADGVIMHRAGPPSPHVRAVPAIRAVAMKPGEAWWQHVYQAEGVSIVDAAPDLPDGATRRYAPRAARSLETWRNGERLEVGPGDAPALIAVARAWVPGYEAIAPDGTRLRQFAIDGAIIGLEVPAGMAGAIEIRYRPSGLVLGLWIAAATIALMLALLLATRQRGQVAPAAGSPATR